MLLQDLQAILINKLAPKKYKLDSEIYGLQYNQSKVKKNIKKVMLTIDLSIEALHFALQKKVNLIISHHGLVDKPIYIFNQHLINKLILLNKYPISIFVLNSSFIAAEGGVSETLANILYLDIEKPLYVKTNNGKKIPIGRICSPKSYLNSKKKITLEDLIKRIKTHLNLSHLLYTGDLNRTIEKICIIGGNTPDINYISKSLKEGCDCFISGSITDFEAIYGKEMGISLI
ncbi:MAG: Nif3-like dinuclear metal center hexameric protein, partial [Candidatus Thorarchaeota archaeon]